MNVLRFKDGDYEAKISQLIKASSLFDPVIEERTKAIIQRVVNSGDTALSELTQQFDGAVLAPENFAATQAEFLSASLAADDRLRAAVDDSFKNIEKFALRSKRKNWSGRNRHG